MAAIAFDTYKMVKRLRESGFTDVQAEAVTTAVQEAGTTDLSHLATKEDLVAVKTELKADMREMELRITIKLGALMAAGIAIVATLVKLIH